MTEEEFLKKAEDILCNYNNFKEKVLDKSIDSSERKSAAFQLKKIHNALSVLSERDADLIRKRYFQGMGWSAISRVTAYAMGVGVKLGCRKAFWFVAPTSVPYDYILLGGDSSYNRYSRNVGTLILFCSIIQ